MDNIATPMALNTTAAEERQILGRRIGLPLVETLAAVHHHSATRIAWHSHRMFELLFILEGSTAYEFADGQTVEVTGGQFLVVPPSEVHRGLHEVRMPSALCGIVFDPGRVDGGKNTPFTGADLAWMKGQFERTSRAPGAMNSELKRLAGALHRALRRDAEAPDEKPGAHAWLRILTCSAMLESARQLTPPKQPAPQRAIAAALAHLQQNFQDTLSITALAKSAGCGRARFYQLFKGATGMTPNDFLQRLRLKEARALLTGTRKPVTEIALSTGFSSGQYFCHVFRRYTGMTPADFRRRTARKMGTKPVISH